MWQDGKPGEIIGISKHNPELEKYFIQTIQSLNFLDKSLKLDENVAEPPFSWYNDGLGGRYGYAKLYAVSARLV